MDSPNLGGLSTAIIAGLVALTGYLLNQFANRRERTSKVYAEALEAIREYQELPYKIRRRPDSNGTTRAALGDKTGDVVSRLWSTALGFRLTLLRWVPPTGTSWLRRSGMAASIEPRRGLSRCQSRMKMLN